MHPVNFESVISAIIDSSIDTNASPDRLYILEDHIVVRVQDSSYDSLCAYTTNLGFKNEQNYKLNITRLVPAEELGVSSRLRSRNVIDQEEIYLQKLGVVHKIVST